MDASDLLNINTAARKDITIVPPEELRYEEWEVRILTAFLSRNCVVYKPQPYMSSG